MTIAAPTTIPTTSPRVSDLRVVGPRRRTLVLVALAVAVLAIGALVAARFWAASSFDPTTPAVSSNDAAESVHGTADALRTGSGVALGTAGTAVVSDLDQVAHGTAGSVRTGAGTAAGAGAGTKASYDLDQMVHGTAGSLVTGAGAELS